MLSLGAIDVLSWVMWCLCGLITGILAGVYLNSGRYMVANVIVGLGSSLAGGIASWMAVGIGTSTMMLIISILTAIFFSAVVLWLFNAVLAIRHR